MERTWNTWHGPRYMQPGTFNNTQGIKWLNCKPLSPHPPFLIFYKYTFEHAQHRCFLTSFVSLFLTCESLGSNWKKVFCTIYWGFWQDYSRKEQGMRSFSLPTGHSLCTACSLWIKNARISSLFVLKRLCAHCCLCLTHSYTCIHISMHPQSL